MNTYEQLDTTAAMYANECGKLRGELEQVKAELNQRLIDRTDALMKRANETTARALRYEMALRRILTTHWGYDGDCGVTRIAEEALEEPTNTFALSTNEGATILFEKS
jgi:hypothetical protein